MKLLPSRVTDAITHSGQKALHVFCIHILFIRFALAGREHFGLSFPNVSALLGMVSLAMIASWLVRKDTRGQASIASRSHAETFYPESTFGGFTDIDGTVTFYTRVNALAGPDSVVVDFGCGRGAHAEDPVIYRRDLRNLRGRVGKVIGIDVEGEGAFNPTIDEFRQFTPGAPWPLADASVDLVICDSVVEHLPHPEWFFRELSRVVARNGFVCIRTPNAFSYVGMLSRLVPNRYHSKLIAKAQSERKEEDIFPTLYRCNTRAKMLRALRAHGFQSLVYGFESEPRYLDFSAFAYAVGVLHQKCAPNLVRPVLFAFARRT